MGETMTADREVETIRKVDALTRSPNKGEAAAARSRLTALLKKRGQTMADLPSILNPPAPPPARPANIFDGFDDYMEKQEPGYKARAAGEQAKKKEKDAAYRDAVITKYGSKEAANGLTAMEQAIEDTVAPFVRWCRDTPPVNYQAFVVDHELARGSPVGLSLDGWSYGLSSEKAPSHVANAVRGALPLPTTIAEAKAEYDAWRERDKELQAVLGYGWDFYLTLGGWLRESIVHDLLYTGLRAQTAAEALIRQKAIWDSGMHPTDAEGAAMLSDLEHLAALEKTPVQATQAPPTGKTRPVKQPRKADMAQADFGF